MSGRRGGYTDTRPNSQRGAHMGTASRRPRGYRHQRKPVRITTTHRGIGAPDASHDFTPRGISATPEQRILALYR